MTAETLPAKVKTFLDQCPSLHSLGVGVSGGPDSVALLGALVTLAPQQGLRLTVLHVNHALRVEADEEQLLVASLCQRWQVRCVVEKLTPPETRKGIETWARTERYRFFQAVCEQYHLDAVALAHTLDDQAETVLFRLLRGSARRGLAGIRSMRDAWVIRPLLRCSRQEVMAYVSHLQLPYAIDPSNGDLRYMRNKIRHLLLPFLEREFSPHVRRHLASLAETLRVEEDWLESLAAIARERVQDDPSAISVERLAAEPAALRMRILRQWLEKTGKVHDLGQRHIEHLRVLSQGQVRGAIELPGVLAVRRQRNRLVLESKQRVSRPSRYVYALTSGQEVDIPSAGWRIAMTIPRPWVCAPENARLTNRWEAIFDIATLPATVEVRNFRSGDRIRPFGMQGH